MNKHISNHTAANPAKEKSVNPNNQGNQPQQSKSSEPATADRDSLYDDMSAPAEKLRRIKEERSVPAECVGT